MGHRRWAPTHASTKHSLVASIALATFSAYPHLLQKTVADLAETTGRQASGMRLDTPRVLPSAVGFGLGILTINPPALTRLHPT